MGNVILILGTIYRYILDLLASLMRSIALMHSNDKRFKRQSRWEQADPKDKRFRSRVIENVATVLSDPQVRSQAVKAFGIVFIFWGSVCLV